MPRHRFNEQQNAELIYLRIKYDQYFNSSRVQSWEGWDLIRHRMGLGDTLQVQMLRKRWHNLVAKYKTIRDSPDGFVDSWPHFEALHGHLDKPRRRRVYTGDDLLGILEPENVQGTRGSVDDAAANIKSAPSLSSSVKARAPPSHSPPVLVPIPPVTNNASSSSSPPLSAQQQQQQQQQLEHQSQDVCLRWNSYHSNMQQSFPMLLDTEQFVDVTLACEGEFIKCHKMVLSACSSFFGELLAANPCPHPVIVLRGSRMWEIRALVDFMYRGEVNVQQDRLAGLLAAAEEFRVKGLAGSCSTNTSNSANEREAPERAAKRQLKRKAAQPQQYHHQYNESSNPMRQMRPTTSQINSFPKMRIKPRSFASHLMEQLDQSENSVTHSDNSHSNRILKQKPRYNPTTDMEHDDNQPPDEMTNPNCLDGTIRVKEDPDQDESDHDKTPSNLMDSTLDDDHYSSSRYSSENTVPVDPLYMDEHRNELEDSIEEAYD